MATTYTSFLDNPSASALTPSATISYVTTTTTISEPAAILKHLNAQAKHVERKEQKILCIIESADGVCLETDTTFLFKSGGGAYLPQLDDNLLDERVVTFPLVHIVKFGGDGKIQSIRLYWDQGSLLKQVEAIGRTGRNWPIRDGKEQVRTVKKAIEASGATVGMNTSKSRGGNEVVVNQHKKSDSVSALFEPRDPNVEESQRYSGPKHAPRESARPAPRDMADLFVAGEDSTNGAQSRSRSPTKADGVILKAGAGKHFPDNRLFDPKDEPAAPRSPERKKTYPQKYERFEFGDGEDAPKPAPKQNSQGAGGNRTFDFEDFSTPPKPKEKPRPDYSRHWGPGIDEDTPPSPPKRPIVHAARPDANAHFDMVNDAPAQDPNKRTSIQRQKAAGIYDDSMETGDTPKASSRNTTSTNNGRRGQDFNDHFSMGEKSPAPHRIYKTAGDGMGARKLMQDENEPIKEKKIYKTAGDGMGGRKGSDRIWGIGDDSDPEVEKDIRATARSRRAQAAAGADF